MEEPRHDLICVLTGDFAELGTGWGKGGSKETSYGERRCWHGNEREKEDTGQSFRVEPTEFTDRSDKRCERKMSKNLEDPSIPAYNKKHEIFI